MWDHFWITLSIYLSNVATSTSPSLYIQVVGTAVLYDEFTTFGTLLNDPIITLAPSELTTWQPAYGGYGPGTIWSLTNLEDLYIEGSFEPLDVRDLACPTWGLGRSTSANGEIITIIGPPFLPLLAPPNQALTLDPAWLMHCTTWGNDSFDAWSYVLFDPPQLLALEPRMLAAPSSFPGPAIVSADLTTAPAMRATTFTVQPEPASSPIDPKARPVETRKPAYDSHDPPSGPALGSQASSEPSLGDPLTGLKHSVDSSADIYAPRSADPETSALTYRKTQIDAAASPRRSDGPLENPSPIDETMTPSASLATGPQEEAQTQSQGLGAIIFNALGVHEPQDSVDAHQVIRITLPASTTADVTVAWNQIISIDPSSIWYAHRMYSAGGPAMTIAGNIYTVAPNLSKGKVATGSHSGDGINDVPLILDPPTLGQHTVKMDGAGIAIDGATLLSGADTSTLSITPISLNASRIPFPGPSSMTLPPQPIFTVGCHTFKANPVGFLVNGGFISPEDRPRTINGAVINLKTSENLIIGSSTYSILAQIPTLPTDNILTVAGQTITANPSAFAPDGTCISVRGPGITVNGTLVSLALSGVLIVGSSTVNFIASPPLSSVYIMNGLSVQHPEISFAVVDRITVIGGAAGITVAGTRVSLELGGKTLYVGHSKVALPTSLANWTAGMEPIRGGQRKDAAASLLLLLVFMIVLILVV